VGEPSVECRVWRGARPTREASENGLLVRVRAPAPERGPSLPLQLVVLLDASGSMEGPPLDAAREAIPRLAEALADRDRLALIAFDGRCRGLVALRGSPSARQLRESLARVRPGEGRDLAGALRVAERTLADAPTSALRRVVLVSNAGAPAAYPRRRRGEDRPPAPATVPVIAVGVGPSFDDASLGALAERSGGRLLAVVDPRALSERLARLGERLAATSLSEVEVSLQPLRGNRVRVDGEPCAGPFAARLHDLCPDETREAWIPLEHQPRPAGEFVLGRVFVSALDRARGGRVVCGALPSALFVEAPGTAGPDPDAQAASLRATASGWLREALAGATPTDTVSERLLLAAELLERSDRPRAGGVLRRIIEEMRAERTPPTNQLLRSIVLDLAGGMDFAG
jgi:hypothetical protein